MLGLCSKHFIIILMASSFADGQNNDIVLNVIIVNRAKRVFDEKQYKKNTPVNIFTVITMFYALFSNR